MHLQCSGKHRHLFDKIQFHALIVYLLPWMLSATWAVLGPLLVGHQNIGACELISLLPVSHLLEISDKMQGAGSLATAYSYWSILSFSPPTCIIVFVIVTLYLRLSYILLWIQSLFGSPEIDTMIIL